MPNFVSYQYQISTGTPGSAVFNASSYSTLAPDLYDLLVGDTTTGYTLPSIITTGGNILGVLIDLGSSGSVSEWEFALNLPGGVTSLYLHSSSNGTSWTMQDAGATASSTGSQTRTIATVSDRYWQIILGNGNVSNGLATDFRLYDASGTIYGPPGTGSSVLVSGFRNSQTF